MFIYIEFKYSYDAVMKNLYVFFLLFCLGIPLTAGENAKGTYIGLGTGVGLYDDSGMLKKEFDITLDKYPSSVPFILYLGYQFNRVFAIEWSFQNYGRYEGSENYAYEPRSVFLGPNLGYSFNDAQFRVFVLFGWALVQGKQHNLKADGGTVTPAFHPALGVQYEPNEWRGVGVRLSLSHDTYSYTVSSYDSQYIDTPRYYSQSMTLLSVALQYKF